MPTLRFNEMGAIGVNHARTLGTVRVRRPYNTLQLHVVFKYSYIISIVENTSNRG